MKIVFLDFDGVLNSRAFLTGISREDPIDQIDPSAVARVQRICDATGAHVVISSTWRLIHNLTELWAWLVRRGFRGRVVDRTPELPWRDGPDGYRSAERGDEIQAWLDTRGRELRVNSYVAIDDDSDMTAVRDRFVQTSFETGIQDEHVERAINILHAEAAPGEDPLISRTTIEREER